MAWLMGVSMRFGRLVVAAALGLLLLAFVQLRDAPVDVYPELMPPAVQIQTEALGLSAAEVEQLVTVPLEQDLLNGVPWLDHISSKTTPGLSTIDLVFVPGTDLYAARQMVQERLSQAHVLPNVGSAPVMIQPLASASRVAMVGLRSKDVSLVDMSVLARWKIRPRLMGVPGVANVSIYGQRDRQLQVQVDPARLNAAGVSLTQVIETAGNALWVSPLSFVEASTPGTGGFVEGSNQRLAIQHVLPIRTPQQLAEVPVEGTAAGSLRLGDVATVVEDHQPLIGDALLDGGAHGLYLVIDKSPGANPREVADGVEAAMADLAPGLSGVTVDTSVYRPSGYLRSALGNLGLAGLLGLLLMLAALFLTLSSWRAVLVVGFSVLASLAAAALVLAAAGATFTTMTLLGVAAALAFVVDDGVRDVESVRAGLRERGVGSDVRADASTVLSACLRTRAGLVSVLLVALAATVPLLVMGWPQVAFSRSAVAAYAVALVASMLVAVVVTPTMAALLLRRSPAHLSEGPAVRVARRVHERWAGRGSASSTPSARMAWVVAAVLGVACLLVLPQLGSRPLLPTAQDRSLLVHLDAVAGTSLPEMDRVTARVARELSRVPGVGDVGAHVGRAVTSDQDVDVSSAEIWLQVEDQVDYADTVAAIARVVGAYPGIRGSVGTYTADRVLAATDPTANDLVVRVFGQDLSTLRSKAAELQQAVSGVDGVAWARVEPLVQQPVAHVEVDLAAAARAGLRPGDVRRETTTLTSGLIVGSLYEEAKIFDVVVWGGPSLRQSVPALEALRIDTPEGGQVRLGDVASVRVSPEPAVIEHNDVSRSVDVVLGLDGRSAADVAADVHARIATVAMPFEYHAEVVGGATRTQDDLNRVLVTGLACLLVVFLLLQAATHSWRHPALLLLLLPLAVVGAVVAATFVGGARTVGPLAAVFAVAALTVRHGVMLARAEDEPDEIDLTGAGPRRGRPVVGQLSPVLGTALATAGRLLPAAVLGARAGTEILQPFAVTVIGGLVSSTLVVVVVLPALLGSRATEQVTEPTAGPRDLHLATSVPPGEGIGP